MTVVVLALAALLVPASIVLALVARQSLRRLRNGPAALSPVSRQHFALLQGGRIDEAAVAAARRPLQRLLQHGEDEMVEASLRPGTRYVFQVRALADIGTEA